MKTRFESIGVYLPEKILSTKELIDRMSIKPIFDLEAITGIKNRRVREPSDFTIDHAIKAAHNCLAHSMYQASEIEVIISCSITRLINNFKQQFEPPISLLIKNRIGAVNAINFDISNACAGMNTGVYILNEMIKTGAVRNGMVVSGESITLIADTAVKEISNPIDEQFASLTVGDSGACIIMDTSVSKDEGIDFIDITTVAHYAEMCFGKPSILNTGIAMYTDSENITKSIYNWPPLLEQALAKLGRSYCPDDYDFIITHQVTIKQIEKYLEAGIEYFNKPMPATLYSVDEFGNTASTSHYIVLYNKIKEGLLKKGSRILILVMASGVQLGFVSFTLGELEV